MEDTRRYDDIINLPHHVSPTRPHMSMLNRAAQFSPFAALQGFDDSIKETARLTDERTELDGCAKAELDIKLQAIQESLDSEIPVSITYFQPDSRKAGGAYITVTGLVCKIDEIKHVIQLSDRTEIAIDEIVDISSELFQSLTNLSQQPLPRHLGRGCFLSWNTIFLIRLI